MFKSLANKLLQRCLAPYVEGISEDKLNMRYGHVSLKSVQLKATLFADLGLDVVDLEEGKLDSVSVDLNPSAAIFSGLHFSLHGLTISVRPTAQQATGDQRPDSEILQEMRDNKRSRVESGARELISAVRKTIESETEEASFGAAFVTNLLQTLKVQIARISIRLRDYAVDSETVAHLDAANLGDPLGQESRSHSMSFGGGGINSGVLETGVAVQGLGLRIGNLGRPLPLLKPLNLQLQFCRDSTRHALTLSFQVGGNAENGRDAGAAITKAQIGCIAATLGSLTKESQRMQSLLVPVGTEELVHLEPAEEAERTRVEFEGLEGRRREAESSGADGLSCLSDTEAWRLQVLWDVVPEPLLTKWILPMVEEEEEAARRRRRQSMRRPCVMACCEMEDVQAEVVHRVDDAAIEMPSSLSISVAVESFSFDIYDEEVRILMITVENSAWELSMESRLDHKSLPTAAVSFTAKVGYLFAEHKHEPVLTVLYTFQSDKDVDKKTAQHVFVSRFCNSFEKDRTIISLTVETQPWELVLPDTLIPSLMRFVTEAAKAVAESGPEEAWQLMDTEAADATLDSYFTQGEAWLQSDRGQEVLVGAAERIPEALDIHVTLCGPRVTMALPSNRAVRVMFGSLVLDTPGPCPCHRPHLRAGLRELALEVRDGSMRYDIIEPFSFQTDFAWRDECMSIGLHLPHFHITTSPELLRVLIAAPMSILKHFQPEESQEAPETKLASMGAPDQMFTKTTSTTETRESAMEKRARRYLEKVQSTASEKAAAKTEQDITVTLDVERVHVRLYDASTEVLRLESRLRNLVLTYNGGQLCTDPHTDRLQEVYLAADIFNVRTGRLEPAIEPFQIGISAAAALGNRFSVQICSSRPLLVNVTPHTLKFMIWYTQHFIEVVCASIEDRSWNATTRYHILNLTDETIALHILKEGVTPKAIPPTGRSWISMDEWVIPDRIQQVQLGFDANVEPLRILSLLQVGSVELERGPGVLLAELLRPRVECSLLLISSGYLIINDTSLPFEIRYPSDARLRRHHCVDASLLRGQVINRRAASKDAAGDEGDGEGDRVRPGEAVSVHPQAITKVGFDRFEAQLELRPKGGDWHALSPPEQGKMVPLQCGGRRVVAIAAISASVSPDLPTLRLSILPALRLVSAMPCDMEVSYVVDGDSNALVRSTEVKAFGEASVFDVATPARVCFRVRVDGGLWSKPCRLWVGSASAPCDETSKTEVRMGGKGTAEAAVLFNLRGPTEVAFYCPTWIVDRTGWYVTVLHRPVHGLQAQTTGAGVSRLVASQTALDLTLSKARGFFFCTHSVNDYYLKTDAQGPSFSLPTADNDEWQMAALADGRVVCARAFTVPEDEVHFCPVRCVELLPRLVLQNDASCCVEVRLNDAEDTAIDPGAAVTPAYRGGSLRFRPKRADDVAWSELLTVSEDSAGAACFALPSGEVWTAEVRSDRGVLCVMFREGSDFYILNSFGAVVELHLRGLNPVLVEPGQERPFGWLDPSGADHPAREGEGGVILRLSTGDEVALDPRVSRQTQLSESVKVTSFLRDQRACLEVVPAESAKSPQLTTTYELLLPRIGVSLVGESDGMREVLYAELDVVRICLVLNPKDDIQTVDIAIANLQADWQAADSEATSVVFGQREAPPENRMHPFIRLVAERSRTCSPDLYLKAVRLDLAKSEVNLDDRFASALVKFGQDMFQEEAVQETSSDSGSVVQQLQQRAGTGLVARGWTVPPPQQIMQVEEIHISPLLLMTWCRVQIRKLSCLPQWMKLLLKTMTFASVLELSGALLKMSDKHMWNLEGSRADLAMSLGREYMSDVMRSLASVLGSSSLLNVPRAPLRLGGRAGHLASAQVGAAVTHATRMVDAALDTELTDWQQRRNVNRKRIRGVRHGMAEAFSDVGEGFRAVASAAKKPMEGARKHGAKGFVQGVGVGLATGITTPVRTVANVVMDVGGGVAAGVCGVAVPRARELVRRRRRPRLLAGSLGSVIEYSRLDALVAGLLEEPVEAVIPLAAIRAPPTSEANQIESTEDANPLTLRTLVVTTCSALILEVDLQPLPEDLVSWEVDSEMALYSKLHGSEGLAHFMEPKLKPPSRPNSTDMVHSASAMSKMVSLGKKKTETIAQDEQSELLIHHDGKEYGWAYVIWRGSFPLELKRNEDLVSPEGHSQLTLYGKEGESPPVDMPWELGGEFISALVKVLHAMSSQRRGDWADDVRRAVSKARQEAVMEASTRRSHTEVSLVWEVEQAGLRSWRSWTEKKQQCRWMVQNLSSPHPLLSPLEDWAAATEPPIATLPIWTPTGPWRVVTGAHTDHEGWLYATNKESCTWRNKPRGVFDLMRKRQWEREYELSVTHGNELVDEGWLRECSPKPVTRRGLSGANLITNLCSAHW